jgi:tetratricopeptide (TPR) repeat protein
MKMNERAAHAGIAGAFLALWGFYLHHAAPSVTVGDSGEFIAAAAGLSLPHAPSYPLFTLLGRLFLELVPFGCAAYRMNILSGLWSVAGAALLFGLLRILGASRPASLFAAFFLAATPSYFHMGLVTEVFALNTFIFLLMTFCLFINPLPPPEGEGWDGGGKPSNKSTALAAFFAGLGMANHQTLMLSFPGLAAARLWRFFKTPKSQIRAVLAAVVFFAAGLSLYLFLMLRSAQGPYLDWGNPDNWAGLLHTILRKDYGTASLALGDKQPLTAAVLLAQAGRFLSSFLWEVSWVGAIAVIGGWLLIRKEKTAFAVSGLLVWLFSGPLFMFLGNLPFDAQSTGILKRFLILPVAAAAPFAGFFWDRCRIYLKSAAWLLFLLPAFWLARSAMLYSERNDFLALDYARNITRTLPPGAALFMDGGDDTFFSMAHEQGVNRKRSDATLFDRGGLIFGNPYGADFRRLPKKEKEPRRQAVEKEWAAKGPLVYSTMNDKLLEGETLTQTGFLYRVVPSPLSFVRRGSGRGRAATDKSTSPSSPPYQGGGIQANLWDFLVTRYALNPDAADYRTRALTPYFPYMSARDLWPRGAREQALRAAEAARVVGRGVPWLKENLLVFYELSAFDAMKENNWDWAERLYQKSLDIDPRRASSLTNLGVVYEKKGDVEKSINAYGRALAADPANVNALFNRAVIFWRLGRWDDVISDLQKVLAVSPTHEAAQRYLSVAQAKRGGAR